MCMSTVKIPTTTEAPDETTPVAPDIEFESLTIVLVLREANKTLETWTTFKDILAISVNQYVGMHQLGLELAKQVGCRISGCSLFKIYFYSFQQFFTNLNINAKLSRFLAQL